MNQPNWLPEPPTPTYHLIVDMKLKRPAGLFIQLANDLDVELLSLFAPGVIMDHPTDDMKIVAGTRAQWQEFADLCNRANG